MVGGVDVLHGGRLEGRLHVLRPEVEPVVRRAVLEQVVLAAAVVENHVHHHLQPALVRAVHELLELLVRAEAAVYLVVIRDGIAVVGAVGHVVLLRGVEPDGRHAQVGDVVQVLPDALQVAAVAGILRTSAEVKPWMSSPRRVRWRRV